MDQTEAQGCSSKENPEGNDSGNANMLLSMNENINKLTSVMTAFLTEKNEFSRKRSLSPDARSSEHQPPSKRQVDDFDSLSLLSTSDPPSGSDSEDECLESLQAFYGTDNKKGEKIDEKLAKIVDRGLCQGHLDEEKLKPITDKYPAPENCKIWWYLEQIQKFGSP